jgi:prepilin-type N-terminal cleavage/methylation domain-containing protein
MLQKLRGTNNQGFTLIELMIVIAIIGILAAIAIPNFIAYRNKTFCSATESDANSIASAVADYFSIPTNVSLTKAALTGTNATSKVYVGTTLSNENTWDIDASVLDAIEIQVEDVTGRCPEDYQDGMTSTLNPRGYWDGSNTYVKTMTMQ